MRLGTRNVTDADFVTTSATSTAISTLQKVAGLGALLSNLVLLLAGDAVPRVRQGIEALEGDQLPAALAVAERLGGAVQASQRLVDVPEEPSLLAREEERLLPLHGVRALIGHVERVRAQVAVRRLRRRPEGLVVVPELLEHALALLEQPLLEVLQLLLRHSLRLLGG